MSLTAEKTTTAVTGRVALAEALVVTVPRSLLFVPGGRADMIAKAPRSSPDAIAVDLEDAVAALEHATPEEIATRLREDAVTDGGIRDEVLANAPQAEHGFFAVPKVIE